MVIESLIQDIRQGLRGLQRTPAFTITALITLALGIAATTAIFSVVNAVLLTPPPYPEPDRLLVLTYEGRGGYQSGEMFHYIRDRVRALENVAADGGATGWNLVSGTHAEYVTGVAVSRGYFDVIGVRPLIGRGFTAAEDETRGPRAVVLSDALWRRLFNSRREALGEIIQLGGVPHSVVGVMPADFQSTVAADLWTPLQVSRQNNSWSYGVIGRLKADASETQASADLDRLRSTLQRDVRDVSDDRARSSQWMAYQKSLALSTRDELMLLFGAVSFLLLIACANVASLQLVRAAARRREMATRAALGSGRGRLTQQVLAESVMLSLGGAVLGLIVANWGLSVLLASVPEGMLGTRIVALDWRVLSFVVAVSIGSGILFGLAPAFGVSRLNVREALWESGRHTAGRHSMGLRRMLTVVEVALAVVLLVGAGLLMRSFVNLRSVELGFDPSNTVIGKMSLQGSAKQVPGGIGPFFERTVAQLRMIPGVTEAAVGNNIPVERGLNLAIRPPLGGILAKPRAVDWRYVTDGYFAVFGIPLRAGRAFDDRDSTRSTPVAIVNQAFARAFFGRPQVVGEFVQMMGGDPLRQVVGVVADVKGRSGAGWTQGLNALGAPPPPVIYVPIAQLPDDALRGSGFPISWAVRTADSRSNVAPAIQQTVQSAVPQLPFLRFETMEEVISKDLENERFLMTLLAVFATAAMTLAAIGMYGLTAYTVTQRTQEVGIQIALGATGARVLRTFLSEGFSLAFIGLGIGLAGALLVTQLLSSMIFNVTPHDPVTFVSVAAMLLSVTFVATLLPSVKAARTDPVSAMRAE